jgi:hypothetical protein
VRDNLVKVIDKDKKNTRKKETDKVEFYNTLFYYVYNNTDSQLIQSLLKHTVGIWTRIFCSLGECNDLSSELTEQIVRNLQI